MTTGLDRAVADLRDAYELIADLRDALQCERDINAAVLHGMAGRLEDMTEHLQARLGIRRDPYGDES